MSPDWRSVHPRCRIPVDVDQNKVGFARQYYNDAVRALNETIVAIPGKFFAGPANVVERDFYVVDDPTKRVVPNVSFN